jgi:hypothetical protein
LTLLGKRPRDFQEGTWEAEQSAAMTEPTIEPIETMMKPQAKYQAIETTKHQIERLPVHSFKP